jgi:hypothetical protein
MRYAVPTGMRYAVVLWITFLPRLLVYHAIKPE